MAAFNPYPGTQSGSGAYGSVPGLIGMPTNIYSQVNSAVPSIAPAAAGSAGVINSQIAGQVNPEVQNMLQDKSAAMGVAGGAPGSNFSNNNFTQSLGLNAENLQDQGVGNYLKFLTGVGSTQTDPNLQFEVASQNAVDAAAPNPTAAANQNMSQFQQYLKMMGGPGGGSGIYGVGSANELQGMPMNVS